MTVSTIDIPDVNQVTRTVSTMDALLNTEDVAATTDPVGPVMLAVRRDTLTTAEVSADGDNVALKADSRGALHVAVAPTAKSIAKAEDVASADADVGVPAMAIQKATPANTAGTDGDYEMLQMSAGRLWVAAILPSGSVASGAIASGAVASGAIASGAVASGAVASGAFASGAIGSGAIASGAVASGAFASGALASGSVASGAIASGAIASGAIAAGAIATGATSIAANEDDASANLDTGVKILAIQQSTPADTAGTNGDYAMLQMSAGRLWTSTLVPAAAASIGKAEDVASADADVGVPSMMIQKIVPVNTAGTDGDWEFNQGYAGRQWVAGLMNTVPAATATITRPADTTAYTSGDLVANSVTAGSVAALTFTVARGNALGGEVVGVMIQKSTNVVTNVALRVHLFNTVPTFTSAGDNSALSSVVVALGKGYLGYVDISTFVGFSDVAWGSGAPDNSRGVIPFVAAAATQTIFGIVEARGAFTPGSAEVFTVFLAVRQN